MNFVRNSKLVGAAVVVTAAIALAASDAQQPAPVPPHTPPVAGAPPERAGGGGGPGGPGAPIYAVHCAGCHGTDRSGGRASSLFDEKWLSTTTDERMLSSMKNGVPGTEMPGFNHLLDDQQLWQLVQHIRAEAGSLRPKPHFVIDPDGQPLTTEKQAITLEVVARGLETPWGLAFLPDGRLLITERPGRLRIIDKGRLSDPIKGIPNVHEQQDGGMLDVEVHPRYAENGWIYLAYAEVRPGFVPPPPDASAETPEPGRDHASLIPSMTIVVRGRLKTNEWTDQEVIFRAPATLYSPSGEHFGCRMIFDRQGHLFFTIGDRGTMEDAQDLSKATGKIHRVTDNGGVPKDNPFVNLPGALGTIWSYGHRNPEGLAWDPVTGRLWESEHGPSGGDEINVIEPGHNYGWGVATKGVQNGIARTSEPGMDDPVVYYTPAIGPAGIAFYTGHRYPAWRNTSLFVAGLVGQALRRLEISGTNVTHQETIFDRFGRVRDIVQGPDGWFYVALQNPTGAGTGLIVSASTPGIVIRLVPGE